MLRALVIAIAVLSACAAAKSPTLALYPLGIPSLCWFCDGDGTVFVVDNPTGNPWHVEYACEGSGGPIVTKLDLKPYETVRGIGVLENKERYTTPCSITEKHVLPDVPGR